MNNSQGLTSASIDDKREASVLEEPKWLSEQSFVTRWFTIPRGQLPFDPVVLCCSLFIMLTGFVMITSASLDVAEKNFHNAFFFSMRHGVFIILSLVGAFVVWKIYFQNHSIYQYDFRNCS